jgi:serine/threonine-protein kinase
MPGAESGPLAGAAARNSRFAALRGGPELNTPPGDAAAAGDGNPSLRPAFGNQPPPPPEPPLDRGPAGGTGDSPSKRFLNRHTRRVLVVATAVVLLTAGTYAWSLASSRSSDKPAATPLPSVVPPTGKCVVSYAVYSEANGRFSAQVTLANRNDGALKNWKLWFIMPGDQTISGNGKVRLQQQQHTVTVTSAAALNAQKAVTMPITGRYTANNTAPLAFRLNGYTCETYVSSKPGEPAKQVEHLSDGTVKLSTTPATSSPVVGVSVDPTGGVHITPTTAPAANPTQTIPQGGGVVVTTTPAADATTTGGVTVTTPTADASTTVAPDPGETKADPTTTPPTTVPTATTPAPPGGDGPSVNCEPTATEDC